MKRLNKKGFTLVELLAVIVVLAVIMIIAVPSVLDAMNSARQSSFVAYGEKMLNSAQARYQSDQILGLSVADDICYDLSSLVDQDTGDAYTGYVEVITGGVSGDTSYKITFKDKNYSVTKRTFKDLEKIKAKETAPSSEAITTLSGETTTTPSGETTNYELSAASALTITSCKDAGYTKNEAHGWYSRAHGAS